MGWEELSLDRIYFDSDIGVAGTIWPIGTPRVPSNVIADVITMCAARNLYKIDVHGALTLGAAMQHYCFFGAAHEDIADILDLSGVDVDGSHIEGLIVTGGQGGANFLTLISCLVNAVTTFNGRMERCDFWGGVTSSFKDVGYIDLIDCTSIYGVVTITVQAPARASIKNWNGNLTLTAQDGGLCFVRGIKGTLEIDAMTLGTLNVYANGADITINANCTGGTINIYGNARVTDNSGATVVNDYSKETQLDAIEAAFAAVALEATLGTHDTDIKALLTTIAGYIDDEIGAIIADIGVFPTANYATLAAYVEDIRTRLIAILADVTGIAGAAMRGTDNAALAANWTAALATALAAYTAVRGGYLDQLDFNLQEKLTEIDAEVEGIGGVAMRGTDNAALAANWTAALATALGNYTAARAVYLDELAAANIPADIDELKTSKGRMLFPLTKWSEGKVQVQITAAGATIALPTITIANLPATATIVEAYLMFKFRMIENKYAGVNKLNGATVALTSQVMQIQDDGGGAWADGINYVDDFHTLADGVREGGDLIVGTLNVGVANVVDGNDTYNVRLLLGKADQDFINFDDCQVGLAIRYSV